MKILSISIFAASGGHGQPSTLLANVQDTSSFSFFQARSIGEFLTFFSKTVADRTTPGQRQTVAENSYMAHVYSRVAPDSLTGVIIADEEYPPRVAFSLLNKLLDEYSQLVPRSTWSAYATKAASNPTTGKPPATVDFPALPAYLVKYQDPKQADTISKVQQELDDTKDVMVKTIEAVLERGEKLDSLVEKSNQLSYSSKAFYKTAKSQNSC